MILAQFTIRPETPADYAAIESVHRLAFGGEDEARLVSALRNGGYGRLSLVADEQGLIVGHIYFSQLPIVTDQGEVEAISLAPMAVLPNYQRREIGTRLVEAGLRACGEQGHTIVVVLGHPKFYRRFGFSPQLAEPLASPFVDHDAWMALELAPGALANVAGRVVYPPPFGVFKSTENRLST